MSIYPVKGCRGIALQQADVLVTGLAANAISDREWMVIDRNGCFVTQREHPRLALVETALVDGSVQLSRPGVEALAVPHAMLPAATREVTVWHSKVRGVDQGDAAAAWLSAFLRADVRLVRFDPLKPRRCNPDYAGDSGAHTLFADGYPILAIGEASLADLNARLVAKGAPALPMNRFRPNVVIAGIDPYAEDHLDTLVCEGVTLRFVKPCTRCTVTTTDQATGRRGSEPLPTLSTYRRNDALAAVTFGMNAIVEEGAGRTLATGMPAQINYRFY